MWEIIKRFIDKLKLVYFVLLVFISGMIITFLPQKVVEKLSLVDFKNKYQSYISLAVIVSGVLLLILLVAFIYRKIMSSVYSFERRGKKYLTEKMSLDENSLLVQTFYSKENHIFLCTGYIDLTCGIQKGLEYLKIIYRSSSVGANFLSFSYNLQPYVLDFLNNGLARRTIYIQNELIHFKNK
jgi:predicted PurR-regulated permease PerM